MSNSTPSTSTEINVTVYHCSNGLYLIRAYAGRPDLLKTPIAQTSTYFPKRVPAKKAKLLKRAIAAQRAHLLALAPVTGHVEL